MPRRRFHVLGSRIAGGFLAWIMLVAAPVSRVAGQQDVGEVDDEDIVLPTVVLELDEPGADGLEVALPLDIQVVAPEIWPPLPEASELDIDLRTAVAAPTLEFAPAAVEGLAQTLVAEAYVSVGTTISTDEDLRGLPLAQLDSGLSVLGSGSGSDFALAFTHSLRDGVRNHRRPGEGANTQRHALSGSIAFGLGPGQLDVDASIVNSEQGFGALCRDQARNQAEPPEVCKDKWQAKEVDGETRRNSAESQAVAAAASYRVPLGDQFELTTAVDLRSEATTLTGRNAETHSELSAAPELTLDWNLDPVDLQFNARYRIRPYEEFGPEPKVERCPESDDFCTRHNLHAGVTGAIDLGGQMGLELSLAWSWRHDRETQAPNVQGQYGGHRFVPQAVISGTPASWFTFRVAGGYEVRELGVASVTDRFRYVEPTQVVDDDGWFAFGRAQFGLGELTGLSELAIVATTRLASHSRALAPSELNDRNLYRLNQEPFDLSVVPGLGLSLGLGDVVEIRANVSGEVMTADAPRFTPQVQSELEVEAHTPDGGLGVRLNATMDSIEELGGLQTPEVEIEGLWREGATTVTVTLTDLLELASAGRKDWAPYLRPGFGAAVSVQLAL